MDEADETLSQLMFLVVERSGGQRGGWQRILAPHISNRLMEDRGTHNLKYTFT